MPLEQRYAFYLEVYRKSSPHRTDIANDLVALGQPAWVYTLKQAVRGGYYDALVPAIPVLNAFNRKCTATERRLLVDRVKVIAPSPTDATRTIGDIDVACGVSPVRR
jgi:hypothetical protein